MLYLRIEWTGGSGASNALLSKADATKKRYFNRTDFNTASFIKDVYQDGQRINRILQGFSRGKQWNLLYEIIFFQRPLIEKVEINRRSMP